MHAEVKLTRYRNAHVEIEVDTPAAGFVVLNDIWHPWWRAEVDGVDAEILKANVLFRAVQVPAGKHVVRFTFRPLEGRSRSCASASIRRSRSIPLRRPRGASSKGRASPRPRWAGLPWPGFADRARLARARRRERRDTAQRDHGRAYAGGFAGSVASPP